MKTQIKRIYITIVLIALLFFGVALISPKIASAETLNNYGESYRNHLAFSALKGWNNDPNGLLYVDGTYHMYYQYNYKDGQTENVWGNISWGHATSTDLVHWEEKEVAIPAYQTGSDGNYYAMMFSGSAVYDLNNTSGLFDTDSEGKVLDGQGIVAILTQPIDGIQRQILAYSKDNGDSFMIHSEVLSSSEDGGLGDNEFRDPKVFWSEEHGKWLMAVGGGSIRMYSSTNLIDWFYLGETSFWGECPDISKYVVNGENKYVLVFSPEDKSQSYDYNESARKDDFYPSEYYVVGNLNSEGLFVATQSAKRLSYGLDTYAFQSFNNSPDGKVYGISWSASWKNVNNYEKYRKTHNGGMTIACEMNLVKEGKDYILERKPVESFSDLRDEELLIYNGVISSNDDVLKNINASIADS